MFNLNSTTTSVATESSAGRTIMRIEPEPTVLSKASSAVYRFCSDSM